MKWMFLVYFVVSVIIIVLQNSMLQVEKPKANAKQNDCTVVLHDSGGRPVYVTSDPVKDTR